MTQWKERGDTIVEVLIAMAVVSMVLGGAYASVNRSTIQTRTAQERGEALQLLQGQVERLKGAVGTFDNTDIKSFCINESANARVDLSGGGTLPASVNNETDWSEYPPDCRKAPQGGVIYNLAISRAANSNDFALYARWEGLGNVNQEVRLAYRYYQ